MSKGKIEWHRLGEALEGVFKGCWMNVQPEYDYNCERTGKWALYVTLPSGGGQHFVETFETQRAAKVAALDW